MVLVTLCDRSLAFGPKGSYRAEHVVDFLRRWLEPWSDERAAANDWRMLYLDAFRAHLGVEIQDLSWSRGYVVMYHGGCTTGICQVNDTDCHPQLENIYMDLEAVSLAEQQMIDPGNIGRSRQQACCLDGWKPASANYGHATCLDIDASIIVLCGTMPTVTHRTVCHNGVH